MVIYAKIKTESILFEPISPAASPNGSLFMDSTNSGALTTKTIGGITTPLGAVTSSDILVKVKQNRSLDLIPSGARVALRNDGSIVLADSDDPLAAKGVGIALEIIDTMLSGRILLDGPNATGVLTGLGFIPGQDIYQDVNPGQYTNNISVFGPSDTIIRVGVADSASDTVSSDATDLILVTEVVSGTDVNGDWQQSIITLTSGDIAAKSIIISPTPKDISEVVVTVIGGLPVQPSVDYAISSPDVFSWDGLGLDGILVEGDKIVFNYFS